MIDLEIVKECIIHSFKHGAQLLPFLFLTYLLMEYLEYKMNDNTKKILLKAEKSGPIWGAMLGMIPQCGFSAAASNLFAGRVITMGTLIAIYLSTSDEMLPIMLSEAVSLKEILIILFMKMLIALTAGLIIDYVLYKVLKKEIAELDIHHFCEHEHCHCGRGILKPALIHTVQIWLFIFLITVGLNLTIEIFGLERLSNSFLQYPVVAVLAAALIGLIPNCASSVLITQLYISDVISFGTMMAGLLVGAGVGILVLLRVNESKKENFIIIAVLYCIGVFVGGMLNLFI